MLTVSLAATQLRAEVNSRRFIVSAFLRVNKPAGLVCLSGRSSKWLFGTATETLLETTPGPVLGSVTYALLDAVLVTLSDTVSAVLPAHTSKDGYSQFLLSRR